MSDQLHELDDATLNRLFIAEVCKWRLGDPNAQEHPEYWYVNGKPAFTEAPDFTKDASAALRRLYRCQCYCEIQKGAQGLWVCVVGDIGARRFVGQDNHNPARAVALAMLRAARAGMVFA